DEKGKALPRGRYLAKLAFKDASGKVRQIESALFFQDSAAVQRERYAEVEGKLSLKGGGLGSANTVVELVDDQGRVVQSTHSTEQGNYRFKNVEGGAYRVRARKEGFESREANVSAAPASPSARADMVF